MIGSVNTGGGSGNVFAFIVVTYPTGSVCTCTDGTKTLTAKDTSGSYVFEIPNSGTWTISCTDGEHTASININITSKGQSDNISLAYSLILYDRGYVETAISGGLSNSNYKYSTYSIASPTIHDADIYMIGKPSYQGIGTNNSINISGYRKLKAIIKPTNSALTGQPWMLVNNSKVIASGSAALAYVLPSQANVENELVIDLESLSATDLYILILVSSTDATGYLYKLWLEK